MIATMHKADWPAIISRVAGVALLLAGVLLAARLCTASPHGNSVPSIFDPRSTPAESIHHLSHFVLGLTGVIFLVVFSLLTYAVVKFRSRIADVEREPAQVYGSTQIELAWTVIPTLIVVVLFLATARVIHVIQDAPKRPEAVAVLPTGERKDRFVAWQCLLPTLGPFRSGYRSRASLPVRNRLLCRGSRSWSRLSLLQRTFCHSTFRRLRTGVAVCFHCLSPNIVRIARVG
jgi:hypothetical protein